MFSYFNGFNIALIKRAQIVTVLFVLPNDSSSQTFGAVTFSLSTAIYRFPSVSLVFRYEANIFFHIFFPVNILGLSKDVPQHTGGVICHRHTFSA